MARIHGDMVIVEAPMTVFGLVYHSSTHSYSHDL